MLERGCIQGKEKSSDRTKRLRTKDSDESRNRGKRQGRRDAWTYALAGDDLAGAGPLGLLLPLWTSATLEVRVAEGEVDEGAVVGGAGRSDGREGLSWGAGDGAMAMTALILRENAIEGERKKVCESLGAKAAGGLLALGLGRCSPGGLGWYWYLVLPSGTRTPLYSALALSRPFPGRVRERGRKVASGGYSAVTVRARWRWMLWTGAALECRTQELGAIVSESATILVSCRVAKGPRGTSAPGFLAAVFVRGALGGAATVAVWCDGMDGKRVSPGLLGRGCVIGARHKDGLKNPSPIVWWGAAGKMWKYRRAGCWMLDAEQRARVRGGLRL